MRSIPKLLLRGSLSVCALLSLNACASDVEPTTGTDSVALRRCDTGAPCPPGETCEASAAGWFCVAGDCTASTECTAAHVCRAPGCVSVDDPPASTVCPAGTAAGAETAIVCPAGTSPHPATTDRSCWICEPDPCGTAAGTPCPTPTTRCTASDPTCTSDGVACADYIEPPDGVCDRPTDDPCIFQDPDCGSPSPTPCSTADPSCTASGSGSAGD